MKTIYLVDVHSLLTYDPNGKLIGSNAFPHDFRAPFCAGDNGRIYVPNKSGLTVYSSSLTEIQEIPLEGVISNDSTIL
jgi:hypothetical protein